MLAHHLFTGGAQCGTLLCTPVYFAVVVTETFSTYGFARLNCSPRWTCSLIVSVKHYKKIIKEDMSVMQLEKDTSTKNLQKGI